MKKFGGLGRKKKCCLERHCTSLIPTANGHTPDAVGKQACAFYQLLRNLILIVRVWWNAELTQIRMELDFLFFLPAVL